MDAMPQITPRPLRPERATILELQAALFAGQFSASDLLAQTLAHPDYQVGPLFTQIYPEAAQCTARAADTSMGQWRAQPSPAGAVSPISSQHLRENSPLTGLAVSVKDLLDVEGYPTWAGSPTRLSAPAARQDAPVVAKLRRAGAAIIGKTTMTELAFSGVGINPHFGTPANPATRALGDKTQRITGGSSSGAAASVASGLCVAAIGSDTGGSLRIPAALCGLVGFKATQRRMNNAGSVALAPSFDTLGAITRSVADAIVLDRCIADNPIDVASHGWAPTSTMRLLLPSNFVLEGIEDSVARAFDAALHTLSRSGMQITSRALPLLDEIAARNPAPGISASEAYAEHGLSAQDSDNGMDEWVRKRIVSGARTRPEDLARWHAARTDWINQMQQTVFSPRKSAESSKHSESSELFEGFDALIMPTTVMSAPPIAVLAADEEAFFRTNSLLLRNTFIANYLDGCAISLPCQEEGHAPVGLMLIAPAMQDARLLHIASRVEAVLKSAFP